VSFDLIAGGELTGGKKASATSPQNAAADSHDESAPKDLSTDGMEAMLPAGFETVRHWCVFPRPNYRRRARRKWDCIIAPTREGAVAERPP
jgi:hypothetical protein